MTGPGSSRSTLSRQDRALRDEIARAIHARWCLDSPCVAENARRAHEPLPDTIRKETPR